MTIKLEKADKGTNEGILKQLEEINTKLSTLMERLDRFYENTENTQRKITKVK